MQAQKSSKIRVVTAIVIIGALLSASIFFGLPATLLGKFGVAGESHESDDRESIDALGKTMHSPFVQPETTHLELAVAHVAPPTVAPTSKPTPSKVITPKPSTKYHEPVYTQSAVKLRQELWPICACESSYLGTKYGVARHFEDGHVIRGYKSPEDIGMCQISLTWHGTQAQNLGYDLFDEADNIRYANYLYNVEGTAPWFRSEFCWMKP